MNNCTMTGAYVFLIDYQCYAAADLHEVAGAVVVRFARDPLTIPGNRAAVRPPTHTLYLNRQANYWRQADAIAVVAKEDLKAFDKAKDVG